MRIIIGVLAGSLATLVLPTAHALARNSDAAQTGEPSIKSPCSSYTQNPDGSWKPIPCEEAGAKSAARAKPTHSSNEAR